MTTTWQNKYVKKRSHLFTVGTERTAGLILLEGSRESFTEEEQWSRRRVLTARALRGGHSRRRTQHGQGPRGGTPQRVQEEEHNPGVHAA